MVNLVNGGKEVVEAICDHPGIRAVSFVGSTPVARLVYQRGTHAGKRVQALGGAKNFIVVMPDADFDRSIPVITESFYGCAGERCLAGSVLLPVGEAHKTDARAAHRVGQIAQGRRRARAGRDDGPGDQRASTASACSGTSSKGINEGAKLALDGRPLKVQDRPEGFFVGPTVFDDVSPDDGRWSRGDLRAGGCGARRQESRRGLQDHGGAPNANATSIFTSSGKAAREFAHRATASMVGVNIGVAAPMAYFPFGGARDSFFGDLKVHGRDAFEFYTDKKVTISRWF